MACQKGIVMEVKANKNVDVAHRVTVNQTKPRPAAAGSDTTSFTRVAALDEALQTTPKVRPEAVARAKELLSDVKYPPAATIEGIAALLALKLETGESA